MYLKTRSFRSNFLTLKYSQIVLEKLYKNKLNIKHFFSTTIVEIDRISHLSKESHTNYYSTYD